MTTSAKLLSLALTLTAVAASASSPFAGTWKMNPGKSSMTGDTMTFAAGANGGMKLTSGGLSYDWKPDGQERAGVLGEMVIWKKIDDRTWEVTHKTKGKVTGVETLHVAADGKSLDDKFEAHQGNGEVHQDSFQYQRVSAGSGLFGKWKGTKAELGSPQTVEMKDYDGGISLYIPSEKLTFSGKFDGKTYPATGPTIPPGAKGTLRSEGPLAFELVEMINSKPFWKGTYAVSSDGKTLTVSGGMIGANEPMRIVYDKQ